MKTIAALSILILASVVSCEPAYANDAPPFASAGGALYATTVTAPAPSPSPSVALVPAASAAPAKRLPTAIPVSDKSVAASFPELAPAPAVPVPAPTPAMPWQQQVLYYLLGFLSLLLTALVPVLVKWLTAKAKLDITATQEALYADLAQRAVQNMEEIAHRAIKANVNPPTGNEKLNGAVAEVLAAADAMGLPARAKDEVVRLVESHLGGTR